MNYYAYSLKFTPRPTEAPKAKHKRAYKSKYLGDSLVPREPERPARRRGARTLRGA